MDHHYAFGRIHRSRHAPLHVEFERSAPDDHQQFLEYLHIPAAEIDSIRNWSRHAEPQP
jgi:hypothetical protein